MFPLPKITLNQAILNTGSTSASGAGGNTMTPDKRKELAAVCPTNAITYKKDTDAVEIENALACVQCMECVKTAEAVGALDGIIVEEDENVFYFTVETFGQITPLQILQHGLKSLNNKIQGILGEIQGVQRNQQMEVGGLFG